MDVKNSSSVTTASEDVYEFKSVKDSTGDSPDRKTSTEMDTETDKNR